MQLFILAVGKGRASPENTLTQSWLSRLPQGGSLIEVESKLPPGQKRIDDESSRLLRAMPDDAALAVLDPRGKDHSSEDLAALIGTWRDSGFAAACFAIGGADGHADALRQKAKRSISFGRATWPHMLFRAMLAEQLYRASSILAGHPYHRGD
jgi:23S rRNA (pseudouridine1915-N3)-methyltransferase